MCNVKKYIFRSFLKVRRKPVTMARSGKCPLTSLRSNDTRSPGNPAEKEKRATQKLQYIKRKAQNRRERERPCGILLRSLFMLKIICVRTFMESLSEMHGSGFFPSYGSESVFPTSNGRKFLSSISSGRF